MDDTTSDPEPTWPDLLTALLAREDLSASQTRWAMREVMEGQASAVQLAGFLVALKAKGITTEELTGLADEMLEHAIRIEVPGSTVDIVGTGETGTTRSTSRRWPRWSRQGRG